MLQVDLAYREANAPSGASLRHTTRLMLQAELAYDKANAPSGASRLQG